MIYDDTTDLEQNAVELADMIDFEDSRTAHDIISQIHWALQTLDPYELREIDQFLAVLKKYFSPRLFTMNPRKESTRH